VLDGLGAGAGDGYGGVGWTSGSVFVSHPGSPGYFNFSTELDPWRDAYEVTAATAGATTLDLTLGATGQPPVTVVLTVRPSTLRVEAHIDGTRPRAWSAAFAAPADEGYLGLGERFTRTNSRGLAVYSFTEEGGIGGPEDEQPSEGNPYPNGEPMTYFPVPFMVSTRGYGFWLDTTYWNEYDLVTTKPDAWRVWSLAPTLAFEVYTPIPGDPRPWPYQLIDLFTQTTGRPMLAPDWTYGPRRRIGHNDRQNGTSEMQAMRDLHLAITAFDDAYHYLPRGTPPGDDTSNAADNLAKRAIGYRAVAYYNSFFSDRASDPIAATAAIGAADGYFLKNTAGEFSKGAILSGGGALSLYILDFTSPAATAWYTALFGRALDAHYDGWMYDFAEYVQTDAVAANGMSGEELHNLYPVLYDRAAHDYLEASPLAGDWLLFARAGYTGSNQYMPQVWSGDPGASFNNADGLPAQVRAGINIGIAGVANWGSDIGGYKCLSDGTAAADGELLARWIEFGATSPNMHDENACVGGGDKATIWTSPDAMAAWRTYALLHTRLEPYFVGLGAEAHATGAPIIRHVFLEHPDRADWAGVDSTFYVGPALLAAPVVARGARSRAVDLPPGQWLDWVDQKLVSGNVTVDAPLAKLPLFLREDHIVPLLDPSIETLSAESDPSVVGPTDVADVYDVVGLVATRASFGASFAVTRAGAFAAPAGFTEAADEAALASCARCFRTDAGAGFTRLRLSTTGTDDVVAGGITLTQKARPRTRWDLFLPTAL
jgi:alpha-D-xyloside xylohydrolase